jgi:hypothetical protein
MFRKEVIPMNRIALIRHLFGPAFRLYAQPEGASEEPPAKTPTGQEVAAALFKAGCSAVVTWGDTSITARCPDGSVIAASCSHAGWLITGGPLNLLSYGVRDAEALERFPDVLASVRAHAHSLGFTPNG